MRRPRRSTVAVVAVMALLIAGAVVLQYAIDGSEPAAASWDESSPFDTARSVLDLLGGVRQSVAANLWSKTDEVFHEYVHDISKEQALYPYYWLITRLDPHFTMAYYFASWMLARLGRVDRGLELAREGLRYNPDSAELQENLAQLYFFFKRDPALARYHILKAIELTGDGEQRQVYESFLRSVDDVISGKREMHDLVPMREAHRMHEQLEEQEGHHH